MIRLTQHQCSLALVGLLGFGCESVLGLEETSFSEPDPSAEAGDTCGDAGPVGRGDGGGSGPSGNEGGRAGARDTSGTTTGGRASGGNTSGDTNAGGRASGGTNAGDANAGGTNAGGTNAGGTNAGDANAGDTNAGDTNTGGAGGATAGGSNDGGNTSETSGPLTAILQSRSADRCVGVVPESKGVDDAASIALVECNRQDPLQHWQRDSEGRLFCPAAGMYLQAAESDAHGPTVSVGSNIDPLMFQSWLFENVHLVNLGGYCVDMPFGDFSDHAQAQLASCHPGPPQAWTLDPRGSITHDGQCLDIFDGIAKDGQSVQTYGCHGSPNQRFVFHKMRLEFDGMCVGMPGEFPPLEHALLELQTCLSETHRDVAKQQFYAEGAVRILGKCLEAGTDHKLKIGLCADNEPQVWRWIP